VVAVDVCTGGVDEALLVWSVDDAFVIWSLVAGGVVVASGVIVVVVLALVLLWISLWVLPCGEEEASLVPTAEESDVGAGGKFCTENA
jgi:hypothetical protein